MPMYSHSRLSVYETCPRQYRFQYVDKVPLPEVRTVEMFVGGLSDGAWPLPLSAALEPFAEASEAPRITLSRRRDSDDQAGMNPATMAPPP